jgi:hypothetical protein
MNNSNKKAEEYIFMENIVHSPYTKVQRSYIRVVPCCPHIHMDAHFIPLFPLARNARRLVSHAHGPASASSSRWEPSSPLQSSLFQPLLLYVLIFLCWIKIKEFFFDERYPSQLPFHFKWEAGVLPGVEPPICSLCLKHTCHQATRPLAKIKEFVSC